MKDWRIKNPDYFKWLGQDVVWQESRKHYNKLWRTTHKEYIKLYEKNKKELRREYMREYMRKKRGKIR